MELMIDRRGFIGRAAAALGFAAVPGTSLLAAPAGWKPRGKPALVFGFITDTHIRRSRQPHREAPWMHTPTIYYENALGFFRDRRVDAVVHGGDMAHRGLRCEMRFHADIWWRFFPDDKLPGGGKVERLFVTGNHDFSPNEVFAKDAYPDPERREQNILGRDIARHWQEIWREPYERAWHKVVKGYHFFGEHFEDSYGELVPLIRSREKKCNLHGDKPFFMVQHMMPSDEIRAKLADFPNAVSLFGHWHGSCAHLGTIRHEEFPLINGPSLRGNDIPKIPGFTPDPQSRCEHSEIQHGYLVSVYGNAIVFERYDFHFGGKIGPDLVLPLGKTVDKPFSQTSLAKTFGTPEFKNGVKPSVSVNNGAVRLEIPPADANLRSRAYAYDIVVVGEKGKSAALRKCVYAAGCDFSQTHPAALGSTNVVFEENALPAGRKLIFAVRPVSSLGTTGKVIASTLNIG